jgi:hypothetical protein
MSRPYHLQFSLNGSHCSDCGKKIKKIYVLLSNNKEYGSECIKKHIGDTVTDEELGLPAWLIEVAENYVQFRIKEATEQSWTIEDGDDFTINFYNVDFGAEMMVTARDGTSLVDNHKPFKINGKTVKQDWANGIYHFLLQRREELKKEGWVG